MEFVPLIHGADVPLHNTSEGSYTVERNQNIEQDVIVHLSSFSNTHNCGFFHYLVIMDPGRAGNLPLEEELSKVVGMEMGLGQVRDVPETHCNATFCRCIG